eukprot:GHUV01030975.1.p1 GENE.GHUV01030975.1~~GHUV01030975.1.p1  ORF type:complete len:164 (-),score=23.38 GHUV01030975.1:190-681(-)
MCCVVPVACYITLSLDGCNFCAYKYCHEMLCCQVDPCALSVARSALSLDGRNFHAWNYRQFVVKLLGVDSESELAYSSTLIAADFSNYSAWHYRTMLLPRLYNEDITTGDHSAPASNTHSRTFWIKTSRLATHWAAAVVSGLRHDPSQAGLHASVGTLGAKAS